MPKQRVVSVAVLILTALAAYLLQPENLIVWAEPKVVAVLLGAVLVVGNMVEKLLEPWRPP